MRKLGEESTPGPWIVDDGLIDLQGQACMLLEHIGTKNEWVAIGINDEDGFAAVVALTHSVNAHLIAKAPLLLECRNLLEHLNDPVYLSAPMSIEMIEQISTLLTKLESED